MEWAGAQSGSTEALPFDVIDLTPDDRRRLPAPESPITRRLPAPVAAVRISIAPGDSLKVRIFERYGGKHLSDHSGMAADLGVQRVAEDGTIKVPVVGDCAGAGLDLAQAENRIIQHSQQVQGPEVIVDFEFPRGTRR